MPGLAIVGLAVGIDVGAREAGSEERDAEAGSCGKQFVDEGVLGAAQGGQWDGCLSDEIGGGIGSRCAARPPPAGPTGASGRRQSMNSCAGGTGNELIYLS